jgi:hypothetical protein
VSVNQLNEMEREAEDWLETIEMDNEDNIPSLARTLTRITEDAVRQERERCMAQVHAAHAHILNLKGVSQSWVCDEILRRIRNEQ